MHVNPVKNEKGEIVKAGCLIFNDQQEILLIHNKAKDIWGLPKGHMELGESSSMTAIRETLEETGLSVHIEKQIDDLTYVDGHGRAVRVHYFVAIPLDTISSGEHDQRWVSYQVALEMVLPHVKVYLEQIRHELLAN